MASRASSNWLLFISSVLLFATLCAARVPYAPGLSEKFYDKSCPQAAPIVRYFVQKFLKEDSTLAGAFNRFQFHDCWVQGCDGSVLLNSTDTNSAEREAHVNFGLRGIKEVDAIKDALEHVCPGVVSCADILILAARDATSIAGGPSWSVALGRRDSRVSNDLAADGNLPFPVFPWNVLVDNFARKNFSAREMVVLSGAHTIGKSHCNGILPHIYNFTGGDNETDIDPTLNPDFAKFLKKNCPFGNRTNSIPIDFTAGKFDNAYYQSVLNGRGVFTSDSALVTTTLGKGIVSSFAKGNSTFFKEYADAMVKMGNLGVLTGSQGEIRRKCQFVNSVASY
ncbi:hypothetical protein R1sor_025867 [Riccia sorocarpa]|uniref:Peroxidase n=1 Tax=Riccia sorocarpa TaxID=122646 RepID=A0ABD3GFF3_9MARC